MRPLNLEVIATAGVAWCDEATFARLCEIADAAATLLHYYDGERRNRAVQVALGRISFALDLDTPLQVPADGE